MATFTRSSPIVPVCVGQVLGRLRNRVGVSSRKRGCRFGDGLDTAISLYLEVDGMRSLVAIGIARCHRQNMDPSFGNSVRLIIVVSCINAEFVSSGVIKVNISYTSAIDCRSVVWLGERQAIR